jgi:MFS family permease
VLATQSGDVALSQDTFRLVVLLSVIPAVLAVLVLAWGAHDVQVTAQRAVPRLSLHGFDRRFRWFLLAVSVFTLGNSADAFLILRGQERGLSVAGVLGMLLTYNIVFSAVAGPLGALSDRIGRARLILGGWTAYGVLYLGFALATQAWHIWVLYALYGLYYGATEGTAKALVADLVGADQRGTAYGVYSAAVGIMALPASLIAGVLWQGGILGWDGFGASAPFLFGAVMALTALGIFVGTQTISTNRRD